MATRLLAHAALSFAAATNFGGTCNTWSYSESPKGISCSEDCYASTNYADRCIEFAKNSNWCQDLTEARSTNFSGLAPGNVRLPCGCWGGTSELYGLKDPTCSSGVAVTQVCSRECSNGGLAYSFVCS